MMALNSSPESLAQWSRRLMTVSHPFIQCSVCLMCMQRHAITTLYARSAKLDWLQPLQQFFVNVSYHILVASLTLMATE